MDSLQRPVSCPVMGVRFPKKLGLLAAVLFCRIGFADTINTFTFTAYAVSNISGSIVFRVNEQDTAGLVNVISADVHTTSISYTLDDPLAGTKTIEIPAAQYSLSDMTAFTFFSGFSCQNPQVFPPGATCDYIGTAFNIADKPLVVIAVEFDPVTGIQAGSGATYTPVPNQPGFHGGTLTQQIESTTVPEPSSFSCLAALGGLIFMLAQVFRWSFVRLRPMSKKDLVIPNPPVRRRWWRTVAGTLWIAGAAANHKNLKHLDPYNVRLGEAIVLFGGTWLILSGLKRHPMARKA